jgi:hypothetical protein
MRRQREGQDRPEASPEQQGNPNTVLATRDLYYFKNLRDTNKHSILQHTEQREQV